MIFRGNIPDDIAISKMIERTPGLVDDSLLTRFIQDMILGAPDHFMAKSSRENSLLCWREGNHSSVANKLGIVKKALKKSSSISLLLGAPG